MGVINSDDGAALSQTSAKPSRTGPEAGAQRVVLVIHGGGTDSFAVARWRNLAVLRLWPFARVIARRDPSAAVYRLKFSIRGWNQNGEAALRDARWALQTMRDRHPGLPIVLVGHSMGGRVALLTGGDPDVAGVVLLAPWAPSDEPAAQLAGVPTVIVRGGRDRIIPPATTDPWIARARHLGAVVSETMLPWAGHAMLRRFWVWHRLAADGVASVLAADLTTATADQPPRRPSP